MILILVISFIFWLGYQLGKDAGVTKGAEQQQFYHDQYHYLYDEEDDLL